MDYVYFDVYKKDERLSATEVTELFLNRKPTKGKVKLIKVREKDYREAATNHHIVRWIGIIDPQRVRAYRIKGKRTEILMGGSIIKMYIPPLRIEKTERDYQSTLETLERCLPGCTLRKVRV